MVGKYKCLIIFNYVYYLEKYLIKIKINKNNNKKNNNKLPLKNN